MGLMCLGVVGEEEAEGLSWVVLLGGKKPRWAFG